jgi:hypothetical protein
MSEKKVHSKQRRSKPERDPADIEAEAAFQAMPVAGNPGFPGEKEEAATLSPISRSTLRAVKFAALGVGLGLTGYLVYKIVCSGSGGAVESSVGAVAKAPSLGVDVMDI